MPKYNTLYLLGQGSGPLQLGPLLALLHNLDLTCIPPLQVTGQGDQSIQFPQLPSTTIHGEMIVRT